MTFITPGTVEVYMQDIVEIIDRQFGEGYAKEHPELVASFVHDSTIDYAAAVFNTILENIADSIRNYNPL